MLLMEHALASPVNLEERQSCPNIHVFGARETTAPAGYGTAGGKISLMCTEPYESHISNP
jgi:acetylxylan esterase